MPDVRPLRGTCHGAAGLILSNCLCLVHCKECSTKLSVWSSLKVGGRNRPQVPVRGSGGRVRTFSPGLLLAELLDPGLAHRHSGHTDLTRCPLVTLSPCPQAKADASGYSKSTLRFRPPDFLPTGLALIFNQEALTKKEHCA